jgi:hypothetical protein
MARPIRAGKRKGSLVRARTESPFVVDEYRHLKFTENCTRATKEQGTENREQGTGNRAERSVFRVQMFAWKVGKARFVHQVGLQMRLNLT